MSVDISPFFQIFFEETVEHLTEMESLLLKLDVKQPDIESFNAIFRAVHSIKGGSGTFGFWDMAEITHVMESLLEAVRNQAQFVTAPMVDALLVSVDVIRQQLLAHQGEGEPVDAAVLKSVCDCLQSYTSQVDNLTQLVDQEGEEAQQIKMDGSLQRLQKISHEQGKETVYCVEFFEVPEALSRQTLLQELARIGDAVLTEEGEHYVLMVSTMVPLEVLSETLQLMFDPFQYCITPITGGTAESDETFGPNTVETPGLLQDVKADLLAEIENLLLKHAAEIADTVRPCGVFDPLELECIQSAVRIASLQTESAPGFFSDNPDVPVATQVVSAVDDGYGFFEDAPGAPPSDEALACVKALLREERCGVFDHVPEAVTQMVCSSEGTDYGFFEGAPGVPDSAMQRDAVDSVILVANSLSAQVRRMYPVRNDHKMGRRAGDQQKVEANREYSGTDKVVSATDSSSIRVNIEKLDHMLSLVGELVMNQSMLMQAPELMTNASAPLIEYLEQLDRNTRDLQEAVVSVRMIPMSFVFSRFPRVVRDIAHRLGKQVELRLVGETLELDRRIVGKITDPLTHLVRNSLDHGFETPDVRMQWGKPPTGILTLAVSYQGGHIVVEVKDDGRGLNRERILQKAHEQGLSVHQNMTDSEVWSLIFEVGFSTAEHVTDVSGRGVGMDIVKQNILDLGGSIQVHSEWMRGTSITIYLPFTWAILDGVSIDVGGELFLIALDAVVESLKPDRRVHKVSDGRMVLSFKDEDVPVLDLHEVFSIPIPDCYQAIDDRMVVIIQFNGKKVAVLADHLLGQSRVLIKSLAEHEQLEGFSSARVIGSDRVARVIDVMTLVNRATDV